MYSSAILKSTVSVLRHLDALANERVVPLEVFVVTVIQSLDVDGQEHNLPRLNNSCRPRCPNAGRQYTRSQTLT